jgi:hypothetical protein
MGSIIPQANPTNRHSCASMWERMLARAERPSRQAAKLVDQWKSRLVELDRAGVAARQAKLWTDEHT